MQTSRGLLSRKIWAAYIAISYSLAFCFMPSADAQVLGASPETAAPVRASQGASPLVMLTMARDHSLFFPAYNDLSDITGDGVIDYRFNPNFEYLGLYNSYYCYSYTGDTSNDSYNSTSNLLAGNGYYFNPTANALTNVVSGVTVPGSCVSSGRSTRWSGNWLNYVTTSRIDAMRVALYGGHREVDLVATAAEPRTILRRAYIPQDGHAWAKEYTSIANDGYDIRLYTPLDIPLITNAGIQRRHFFGNLTSPVVKDDITTASAWTYDAANSSGKTGRTVPTTGISCATLNDCSNYPPLLRVITNSANRVWYWASSERPVLNYIRTPSTYNGYVSGYANKLAEKGTDESKTVIDDNLTLTDYTVRVQACATNFISGCKAYTDNSGNINYKPVGVLHDYGENGSLNFGLITGSYDKNFSGGRLRKNMGSFAPEVSTTTGKFLNPTNSLISQMNNIRIRNFNNPSPNLSYTDLAGVSKTANRPVPDYANDYYSNNFVYKNQFDQGSSLMTEGTYGDWGNPVAEMMYEGLRYFAGSPSATTSFGGTATEDTAVGLDSPSWTDPYTDNTKWCAKPNLLVVSGANPSFDSDQLPGSTFLAGGFSDSLSNTAGTDLNVTTLADSIGSVEGINGTSRFIGESYVAGATPDNNPTLKSISTLGKIRGLIPDETTSQGSYYAAAVAYYGKRASLRTVNSKKIYTVDTYALLLNSPFPTIKVPFPGGKAVTIVPFAKTVYQLGGQNYNPTAIGPTKGNFQPTNQIVGTYITYLNDATNTNGQFSMKFYVNYEDHSWGSDFEMDAVVFYEIDASSTSLTIKITPTYQGGGAQQNIGYVITGTTADGPYLAVQDQTNNGDPNNYYGSAPYYLNVPPNQAPNYCYNNTGNSGCDLLPNTGGNGGKASFSSVTFTPAGSPSENTLKNPLWYASRWGGYIDGSTPTTALSTSQDPDHYTQVTSPGALKTAFARMFQSVLDKSATLGTVTSSSQQLQTTSQIFTTSNNASTFYGELTATNFTVTSGAQSDTITYSDIWTANAKLPTHSLRNILYKNPSDGTLKAFNYSNLNTDYSAKSISSTVVDYLRGNQVNEVKNNGTFRNRTTILGTAINSVPLYSQDTGMVYLGANDGMLHAFDASTGTSADGVEKFAYVPTALISANAGANDTSSALNLLSKTTFTGRFYVDGNIAISDKYKADTDMKTAASGHNYLVGFLGRGGKGLFALPVNTAGIKTDGGVWEKFGDSDTNDMGYLLGKPLIEQLSDGTNVVIFGNGYNSASNQAALYVVRLWDGLVLAKFLTCTGGIASAPSTCTTSYSSTSVNGLATPGVVRSGGYVKYAYAGDYLGNVWKFDLTGLSNSMTPLTYKYTNNLDYASNKILKLFTAVDASNKVQHIVAPITTAYSSDSTDAAVANKRFVFFGTGSDLTSTSADISNTTAQTMYGLIDSTSTDSTTAISNRYVVGNALKSRTIDATGYFSGYKGNSTLNVRSFSQWEANDMDGKSGWYMDWTTPPNSAAEQVFSAANLRSAATPTLTVSSSIVNNASCTTTGAGYLNAMDAYRGGSLSDSYFDINRNGSTSDETFTVSNTSKTVGSIDFGVGTIGQAGFTGDNVVVQGSGINTGTTTDNTADVGTKKYTKTSRRVSWREIVN